MAVRRWRQVSKLTVLFALTLTGCHSTDRSEAKIKDLQREVARLQEENRRLNANLAEVRLRYGIRLDSLQLATTPHATLFDRVFVETKDRPIAPANGQ
jgi:hypothetical protein